MNFRIKTIEDTLQTIQNIEPGQKPSEDLWLRLVQDFRVSVTAKQVAKEIVIALETEVNMALQEAHQEMARVEPLTRREALAKKLKIDLMQAADAVAAWVLDINERPLMDFYASVDLEPSAKIIADLSAPDTAWGERLRDHLNKAN
jgi:hypothetical protein